MKDFCKDLVERMYINTFVENGGKFKFMFSKFDFDNNENMIKLHERFFATQNGIFLFKRLRYF